MSFRPTAWPEATTPAPLGGDPTRSALVAAAPGNRPKRPAERSIGADRGGWRRADEVAGDRCAIGGDGDGRVDGVADVHDVGAAGVEAASSEIGRASCRERV